MLTAINKDHRHGAPGKPQVATSNRGQSGVRVQGARPAVGGARPVMGGARPVVGGARPAVGGARRRK